jgi:hypothetical protein
MRTIQPDLVLHAAERDPNGRKLTSEGISLSVLTG